MKTRMKKKTVRIFIAIAICALAASVVVGLAYFLAGRQDENPSIRQVTWNGISNVRIDFNAMVTNRFLSVGTKGDPVKAQLVMKEMYCHNNDFVLPFKGRISVSHGAGDCFLELRAPIRFETGKLYAGELRIGAFSLYGLDAGSDEEFIASTLFEMVRRKIEIIPYSVDLQFKAIHSVNNDFIEFER